MQTQVLSPGVQNAEEADLAPRVSWGWPNFEHGLSGWRGRADRRAAVDSADRAGSTGRAGKDDVEVGDAEQILFVACQPALARLAWHLRLAVATGVIGNGLVVATEQASRWASERSPTWPVMARNTLSCW